MIGGTERLVGRTLIVIACVLTVLPLVTLLSAALQEPGTLPRGIAWPSDPHWGNFRTAFETANVTNLMISSSLIVLGVVPASIVLATAAGFALAKLKVPGRRILFVLLLAGLTVPVETIITPLYFQITGMGLMNSRWAVIFPLIALFMPFSILWMRAHFVNIPHELTEAARLDGASTFKEFVRVQLPLALPSMAGLSLLLFLWSWNHFILAITFLDDPSRRTMGGALQAFQGRYATDIVLTSAGTIVVILPTIAIFIAFQRHFVRSLLQGALKG